MLPSVANFDVVVTSVTDAGHFFVQLHNDFMQRQLQDLHQNMLQCYGQGTAPLILPLPQPIVVGSCCAAPAYTYNGWYRAQVLGPTANPDEVEVKYLDYGGYGRIAASSLRQLRWEWFSVKLVPLNTCSSSVKWFANLVRGLRGFVSFLSFLLPARSRWRKFAELAQLVGLCNDAFLWERENKLRSALLNVACPLGRAACSKFFERWSSNLGLPKCSYICPHTDISNSSFWDTRFEEITMPVYCLANTGVCVFCQRHLTYIYAV